VSWKTDFVAESRIEADASRQKLLTLLDFVGFIALPDDTLTGTHKSPARWQRLVNKAKKSDLSGAAR
jgi:hypothetical protein